MEENSNQHKKLHLGYQGTSRQSEKRLKAAELSHFYKRLNAVKKFRCSFSHKDEAGCCVVDSKVILVWPYNKLHILPAVRTLDILAKGKYTMGMKTQKLQ